MIFIPLILAYCLVPNVVAQEKAAAPVFVAPVRATFAGPTQSYIGTIVPSRRAIIGSAVDGRVQKFHARLGQRIQATEPLAELLTETIQLEIEAAEAELDMHSQQLDELKNGARVEEIAQASAERDESLANAEYANQRLRRVQQLKQGGSAATNDQLQAAAAAEKAANSILAQKQEALKLIKNGPRSERIKQAEAMVRMKQATLKKLRDQKRKHTIISRFDGYVVEELSEEGQWVRRGDPIAEVVHLDVVEIVANVLESHVPFIRIGLTVEVDVPAVQRKFSGKICAVLPEGDARSRTFPVRIEVTNPTLHNQPVLKSGMLARVLLPTGEGKYRNFVPKDSLVFAGDRKSVFIVLTDSNDTEVGSVQPVSIVEGVSVGEAIAIEGALESDSIVVVQGNERLRPGQRVRVVRRLETRLNEQQPASAD